MKGVLEVRHQLVQLGRRRPDFTSLQHAMENYCNAVFLGSFLERFQTASFQPSSYQRHGVTRALGVHGLPLAFTQVVVDRSEYLGLCLQLQSGTGLIQSSFFKPTLELIFVLIRQSIFFQTIFGTKGASGLKLYNLSISSNSCWISWQDQPAIAGKKRQVRKALNPQSFRPSAAERYSFANFVASFRVHP